MQKYTEQENNARVNQDSSKVKYCRTIQFQDEEKAHFLTGSLNLSDF